MTGVLHLVATPIGNLGDISLRGLETLKSVDAIYCEDSRQTGKLCAHYDISTARRSYHEHNAQKMRPLILQALQDGQNLALVSDAGTPLINDPGYKLVRDCQTLGLTVTTLPGACAPISALILSGLPSDEFSFRGFMPTKTSERKTKLEEIKSTAGTHIFFESPHRLADTLQDISDTLGDRSVCVARELTKTFEEIKRGTALEILDYYETEGTLKGEIVLLIEGQVSELTLRDIDKDILKSLLQVHPVKQAASMMASATGLSRKELYQLALEMRNDE